MTAPNFKVVMYVIQRQNKAIYDCNTDGEIQLIGFNLTYRA